MNELDKTPRTDNAVNRGGNQLLNVAEESRKLETELNIANHKIAQAEKILRHFVEGFEVADCDENTRDEIFAIGESLWGLAKERDSLSARLVEAEKDKKRLDWLESRLNSSYLELCHYKYASQLSGEAATVYNPEKPFYIGGEYGPRGESLRQAIDSAINNQ